jgi:hypothetical protein
MNKTISLYCDESRHLPHDQEPCMVLGALWCFSAKARDHNAAIAELKKKHNLSPYVEIKWTKVSPGKLSFYIELLDLFFNDNGMGFRAWVIPDKSVLKHEVFSQTHDDWYYKMYFFLLRNLIWPNRKYNIYLDIKDTRSRDKLARLHEVLQNAHYDFSREVIQKVQHVHSHDIGLMQLADLLIGAISYNAAGLKSSPAKCALVEHIKTRTGLSLSRSTLPSFRKFNICIWHPGDGGLNNA